MYEHRDGLASCSREDLEDYAIRAAVELRMARADAMKGRTFSDLLSGLMIGVIICAAAYLLGANLR